MRKLITALGVAAALATGGGVALAESPAQECEATGGTFAKEQGTQTCTITTTPGKNQGGVTKVEEESQKGSSRSSHPEEESKGVSNRGGFHEQS